MLPVAASSYQTAVSASSYQTAERIYVLYSQKHDPVNICNVKFVKFSVTVNIFLLLNWIAA